MSEGKPTPKTLSLQDKYTAAVQFYNQEFRTLGERSSTFLTIQSVLVTAFVLTAIYRDKFPHAFTIIAIGISIAGIVFCIMHHLAGKSGSQTAFLWRQYMLDIENSGSNMPWTWFSDISTHTHREKSRKNLISRMMCERCLLDRAPLPHTWLYIPAVFAVVWSIAISYIYSGWFLDWSFHQIITKAIPTSVGVSSGFIGWRLWLWWHNR